MGGSAQSQNAAAGRARPLALISSLSPVQKGSLLSCHPHRARASSDLAMGAPPPAKVWVRWVSSQCQSPLPPPSCPSRLRESRAWVAHREQGGSRGGAQGPPTAMDINHGPTLSTVPPICQGPSLRTEPRQGHSTARAGACPTSSLCCPLPG